MFVKIRYADKSLFEGEWKDAPAYEIQTIAYVDPNGNAILRHQGDAYKVEAGNIVAVSEFGLIIEAHRLGFETRRNPWKELKEWAVNNSYKLGTMVAPNKWSEIYRLGVLDRDSLR
jgi:hypothetical protein